jgi:hypothetical protein
MVQALEKYYDTACSMKTTDNMLATTSMADSSSTSFFKLKFYHGTQVSESSTSIILYNLEHTNAIMHDFMLLQ